MNKNGNKKVLFILIAYALILCFIAVGTYAYFSWETANDQHIIVSTEVPEDFACFVYIDGEVNPSSISLAPASCTNSKHAIKRTLNLDVQVLGYLSVYMNLSLNINTLHANLAASPNFKYALTTDPNSCTNGVVLSGDFSGKTAGSKIDIFSEREFVGSTNETYYLYVWLDSAETSTATMSKSFNFSFDGNCANDKSKL